MKTKETQQAASVQPLVRAQFPIMPNYPVRNHPQPPSSIPWSLIAPHEQQAMRNHVQSLNRLAERGGLSACEAVAILEDRDWRKMTEAEAVERLNEILRSNVELRHG